MCGCALVPLALWVATSPVDEDSPANSGATAGLSSEPPAPVRIRPGPRPTASRPTRYAAPLRDTATGLCVDIAGGKPAKGAESVVTSCTSAATQQWSYAPDGLLRSLADPKFCLDSRSGFSIRLGSCPAASRPDANNVRYDFIVQGELVPRWNQALAVVPVSPTDGAAMVLKLRNDATSHRWQTIASEASPELQSIGSDAPGGSTASAPRWPVPSST